MTTIVAPPNNNSKWQMGFNSAFKGLNCNSNYVLFCFDPLCSYFIQFYSILFSVYFILFCSVLFYYNSILFYSVAIKLQFYSVLCAVLVQEDCACTCYYYTYII